MNKKKINFSLFSGVKKHRKNHMINQLPIQRRRRLINRLKRAQGLLQREKIRFV